MVHTISIGNFLILSQGTGSAMKPEVLDSRILLSHEIITNLFDQEIIQHISLTHYATIHKNVIVESLTHNIQLSQLTHPKSRYFSILQTIPLSHEHVQMAYGPIVSNINLSQSATWDITTPITSDVALTQTLNYNLVRVINIIQTISLIQGATGFIQDKRWIPNRGDFIPPNAEFIWDVNVKKFVKIPAILTWNPATGYYEGTNVDAFFVQSNGFVQWPN